MHFHFIKYFPLSLFLASKGCRPSDRNRNSKRDGEGLRLQEPNGFWASYDILDLWYQKADYGDIWVPYLHVRKTPAELDAEPEQQFMPDDGRVLPFTT
jgi:hypothetical protein